jgi:hypothetical protein
MRKQISVLSIAAVLVLFFVPLIVLAQTEVQLPADFPKDVPLYKNARLTRVGRWMDNPKMGRNFYLDTADAVEAAIAFYKAQLPAAGWTITKNSFVANPNTISVMKGKRMVMVSPNRVSSKNGEITRIEIILMIE